MCRYVTGFLKSRRDRRKEKDKKISKKKRDSDASSIKSDGEPSITSERDRDRDRDRDKDEGLHSTSETVESVKVDEEGYTIRPKDELWNTEKTSGFYSSSDGESGEICFLIFLMFLSFIVKMFFLPDDEPERKLHVEIKPIANGSNLPSASVDELKATIEGLNINSNMFNTIVCLLPVYRFYCFFFQRK